jgi:Uma2 family endonuclease
MIKAEQFAEIPFDFPVDLVRGEIVEMPYSGMQHGVVCSNVCDPVKAWVRSTRSGIVATNNTGIITERSPDTVRCPDVLYLSRERLPAGVVSSGVLEIAPDLVIDVLSPNDVWKGVLERITEYFAAGVREVWVIDPEETAVHVFRPDVMPRKLSNVDVLESPDVLPGFSCQVAQFFENI